MTLFDPFCLILLLGSEKEKRWKEMEPILVETLKSCTQDGSISGCFLSVSYTHLKLGTPHRLDEKEYRRAAGFLTRKGFGSSEIRRALEEYQDSADEES